MNTPRNVRRWIVAAGLAVALASGYQFASRGTTPTKTVPAAEAAVSVNTVRAERRDVPVVLHANGKVAPLETVHIHPQVASVVSKVHIRDGQFVRQGEPLFTLDSRADRVNVTKAEAQLQQNLARLADAERQFERSRELLAEQFISQSALDTSRAQVEAQRAVVAADRAAVQAARVSLGYSRIDAPTSGRVGAINVFAGSFVQPGGAAPLVTITQLDPIAVAFDLPQRHLRAALAKLGEGVVEAQLPGAQPLQGKLRFVDSAVDANSGTVRVRAVFDNPGHRLWPGAFVNVRFAVDTLDDVVQVPQAAIIQGANGQSVYVVGADGRAALRTIEVLHTADTQAAVAGLEGGERVVLEGRHNLRPGSRVNDRADTRAASAADR